MIGQTISHYRILSKIGEGGMGIVYKAEDTRLDRIVALKFLASHLVGDEDSRRRFIREAKAAASLDHPNICTVYEIEEANGTAFIAMAFIDGTSLSDLIAAGPMKLPEACDIARQAARGLQEAHSKGIVHRDIKPHNILIATTGTGERLVKIMDFGLAQLSGVSKLTRANTTIGTVAYMSPEQTQGTAVDRRSDIWSLGAVFYEMITAQQAFKGHYEQAVMYSILNEEPEPVTTLRAGLPMELEWILGKALAKTPDRRYQSALDLSVDLETLLAKLQAANSTVARTAPPIARTVGPILPPQTAPANPSQGAQDETAGDPSMQRRRTRNLLLDLGGQGLLPDRVLSQALEANSKAPDPSRPVEKRRHELLDELAQSRVRVGEFIESWQQTGQHAPAGEPPPPAPPAKVEEPVTVDPRRVRREWRTKAEIFGWPLIHIARGIHPTTGKRCVAKGILAMGETAVGVIAIGGTAIGLVAAGGLSIGVLAAGAITIGLALCAGAVAVGPAPFGLVPILINPGAFFPSLIQIILVLTFLRVGMRRKRFRKTNVDDGGIAYVWALLGAREWRSDGTPFRGGNIVATFGACDVDLSHTTIAGPEAAIEATAVFGAIKIIVPHGWRVVTTGTQILGGYGNKTRPPESGSNSTAPRLILKGLAFLGGVDIEHPAPEDAKPA